MARRMERGARRRILAPATATTIPWKIPPMEPPPPPQVPILRLPKPPRWCLMTMMARKMARMNMKPPPPARPSRSRSPTRRRGGRPSPFARIPSFGLLPLPVLPLPRLVARVRPRARRAPSHPILLPVLLSPTTTRPRHPTASRPAAPILLVVSAPAAPPRPCRIRPHRPTRREIATPSPPRPRTACKRRRCTPPPRPGVPPRPFADRPAAGHWRFRAKPTRFRP
mmetsp:Transcript_14817/g.42690  ORF Transcript_14817/g.42690 Transcript_14817/m.42690 type:complete len:225 (-) Transcript_14817:1064-1738(-)